jgi:Ni,Fe-hydrogenase I large subunit
MASPINLDSRATINADRLTDVHDMIRNAMTFVEQVYWPDLLAIASYYKEWAGIGGGVANHLACGEFPSRDVRDLDSLYFPRGIILNNNLNEVVPYDQAGVAEQVHSAWYDYENAPPEGLHPYDGQTKPHYTGPKEEYQYLQGLDKYTWMKEPRYNGRPMQVGPLSRLLVGYASGHADVKEVVNEALGKLGVGPSALFSTLGRTAARGIESRLIARQMITWYDAMVARIKGGDTRTFDGSKWEPSTWPKESKGYGYLDAPRGALGHWVRIKDGKIENYQAVVPSTWNASGRDKDGVSGPYEASLMDNHPLVDPERPLEILRTIHSFDPCLACGVHVIDATGKTVTEVKVQ